MTLQKQRQTCELLLMRNTNPREMMMLIMIHKFLLVLEQPVNNQSFTQWQQDWLKSSQ